MELGTGDAEHHLVLQLKKLMYAAICGIINIFYKVEVIFFSSYMGGYVSLFFISLLLCHFHLLLFCHFFSLQFIV